MFYTIYKITNKLNGKTYIGKHQTTNLDDGYMGSGKILKRAIEKYGQNNFTKELLHVFDNEDEMNNKEKELVVVSEETYNLCPGGQGGFGYINSRGLGINSEKAKYMNELGRENRLKWCHSEAAKEAGKKGWETSKHLDKAVFVSLGFKGKTHSEETKRKISETKRRKMLSKQSTD